MTHATVLLLLIYVVAAVIELVGIGLTVNTFITFDDGLGTVHQPESRWQAVRGPVLIAVGVLVGLGGNALSLFIGR